MPAEIGLTFDISNKAQLKAALDAIAGHRYTMNIGIDNKFSQPLGKIRGELGEFEKSLAASNARVLAFAASAGAMYAVGRALRDTVKAAIDVEQKIAEIGVVLNRSSASMAQFSDRLFDIANRSGQTFDAAAGAAKELSRQGLGLQDTLKKTADALLLTRISGLSVEQSVNAITAAFNSFSRQAIDTTRLVNQMAAVDMKFAVSSGDLAEAIRRVGSTADDAGLSMEQLIAMVTAAQHITARGGAVIGNAFKSIFTRLERPKVLEQLESVGVAIKNLDGTTRPVMGVLTELSQKFDTLGDAQRSHVAELVGGVYQMNILKTILRDVGRGYSFYTQALDTANKATDEAQERSEELNKTLSSRLLRTMNDLKKAGASAGSNVFGPIAKKVLNTTDWMSSTPSLDKAGSAMASGLGKVLAGPGLTLATLVFSKLAAQMGKFTADAIKSTSGINSVKKETETIEKGIVEWMRKQENILQNLTNGTANVNTLHRDYLATLKMENAEMAIMASHAKVIAGSIVRSGYKVSQEPDSGPVSRKWARGIEPPRKAAGHIPNLDSDEKVERQTAASLGYTAGPIKRARIEGKEVVYNGAEQFVPYGNSAFIVPPGGKARRDYDQRLLAKGISPGIFRGRGHVPNLAKTVIEKYDNGNGSSNSLSAITHVPPNRAGVEKFKFNDSKSNVKFINDEKQILFDRIDSYRKGDAHLLFNEVVKVSKGGKKPIDVGYLVPQYERPLKGDSNYEKLLSIVPQLRWMERKDLKTSGKFYPNNTQDFASSINFNSIEKLKKAVNSMPADRINWKDLSVREVMTKGGGFIPNLMNVLGGAIYRSRVTKALAKKLGLPKENIGKYIHFRANKSQSGDQESINVHAHDKAFEINPDLVESDPNWNNYFRNPITGRFRKPKRTAAGLIPNLAAKPAGITPGGHHIKTVKPEYGVMESAEKWKNFVPGVLGYKGTPVYGMALLPEKGTEPRALYEPTRGGLVGALSLNEKEFAGFYKEILNGLPKAAQVEALSGNKTIAQLGGHNLWDEKLRRTMNLPPSTSHSDIQINKLSEEQEKLYDSKVRPMFKGGLSIAQMRERDVSYVDFKVSEDAMREAMKPNAQIWKNYRKEFVTSRLPKAEQGLNGVENFYHNAVGDIGTYFTDTHENLQSKAPAGKKMSALTDYLVSKKKAGTIRKETSAPGGKVEQKQKYVNIYSGGRLFKADVPYLSTLERKAGQYTGKSKYPESEGWRVEPLGGEEYNADKHITEWLIANMAKGHIPHLAMGFSGGNSSELGKALSREVAAGYSPSQVKEGYDSRIGPLVYNTTEGSPQNAVDLHLRQGKSIPQIKQLGKARGHVPNLAEESGGVGEQLGMGVGMFFMQMAMMSRGGYKSKAMNAVNEQISETAGIIREMREAKSSHRLINVQLTKLKQQEEEKAKINAVINKDERFRNRALGASFVSSFVGGAAQEVLPGKMGKGVNAVSEAASNAAMAMFAIPGPVGVVVGSIIGAGTAFSKIAGVVNNKSDAIGKELDKQKDSFETSSNSINSFSQVFDKLNSAYEDSRTPLSTITKLQSDYARTLAEIPDKYRALVQSATSAEEAQRAVGEALENEALKIQQSSVSKKLNERIEKATGILYNTSVFNTKSEGGREELRAAASKVISTAEPGKTVDLAKRVAGANINSPADFSKLIEQAKSAGEISNSVAESLQRFATQASGLQGIFNTSTKNLNDYIKAMQESAKAVADSERNFKLTQTVRDAQARVDLKLKDASQSAQKSIEELTNSIYSLASQGIAFANAKATMANTVLQNLGTNAFNFAENITQKLGGSMSDMARTRLEGALGMGKVQAEGGARMREINTESMNNMFSNVQGALESLKVVSETTEAGGVMKNPAEEQKVIDALERLSQLRGKVSTPEEFQSKLGGFISGNSSILKDKFGGLLTKNDQILRELVTSRAAEGVNFKNLMHVQEVQNRSNEVAAKHAQNLRFMGGAQGFMNPAAYKEGTLKFLAGATSLAQPGSASSKATGAFDLLTGLKEVGYNLKGPGAKLLKEMTIEGRSKDIQSQGRAYYSQLKAQSLNSKPGSVERFTMGDMAREMAEKTSPSNAREMAEDQMQEAIPLEDMPKYVKDLVDIAKDILALLSVDVKKASDIGEGAGASITNYKSRSADSAISQRREMIVSYEGRQREIREAKSITAKISSLTSRETIDSAEKRPNLVKDIQDMFSRGDFGGVLKTIASQSQNVNSKGQAKELLGSLEQMGGMGKMNETLDRAAITSEQSTGYLGTLVRMASGHSLSTRDFSANEKLDRLIEIMKGGSGKEGSTGGSYSTSGATNIEGNDGAGRHWGGGVAHAGTVAAGVGLAALAIGTRSGRAALGYPLALMGKTWRGESGAGTWSQRIASQEGSFSITSPVQWWKQRNAERARSKMAGQEGLPHGPSREDWESYLTEKTRAAREKAGLEWSRTGDISTLEKELYGQPQPVGVKANTRAGQSAGYPQLNPDIKEFDLRAAPKHEPNIKPNYSPRGKSGAAVKEGQIPSPFSKPEASNLPRTRQEIIELRDRIKPYVRPDYFPKREREVTEIAKNERTPSLPPSERIKIIDEGISKLPSSNLPRTQSEKITIIDDEISKLQSSIKSLTEKASPTTGPGKKYILPRLIINDEMSRIRNRTELLPKLEILRKRIFDEKKLELENKIKSLTEERFFPAGKQVRAEPMINKEMTELKNELRSLIKQYFLLSSQTTKQTPEPRSEIKAPAPMERASHLNPNAVDPPFDYESIAKQEKIEDLKILRSRLAPELGTTPTEVTRNRRAYIEIGKQDETIMRIRSQLAPSMEPIRGINFDSFPSIDRTERGYFGSQISYDGVTGVDFSPLAKRPSKNELNSMRQGNFPENMQQTGRTVFKDKGNANRPALGKVGRNMSWVKNELKEENISFDQLKKVGRKSWEAGRESWEAGKSAIMNPSRTMNSMRTALSASPSQLAAMSKSRRFLNTSPNLTGMGTGLAFDYMANRWVDYAYEGNEAANTPGTPESINKAGVGTSARIGAAAAASLGNPVAIGIAGAFEMYNTVEEHKAVNENILNSPDFLKKQGQFKKFKNKKNQGMFDLYSGMSKTAPKTAEKYYQQIMPRMMLNNVQSSIGEMQSLFSEEEQANESNKLKGGFRWENAVGAKIDVKKIREKRDALLKESIEQIAVLSETNVRYVQGAYDTGRLSNISLKIAEKIKKAKSERMASGEHDFTTLNLTKEEEKKFNVRNVRKEAQRENLSAQFDAADKFSKEKVLQRYGINFGQPENQKEFAMQDLASQNALVRLGEKTKTSEGLTGEEGTLFKNLFARYFGDRERVSAMEFNPRQEVETSKWRDFINGLGAKTQSSGILEKGQQENLLRMQNRGGWTFLDKETPQDRRSAREEARQKESRVLVNTSNGLQYVNNSVTDQATRASETNYPNQQFATTASISQNLITWEKSIRDNTDANDNTSSALENLTMFLSGGKPAATNVPIFDATNTSKETPTVHAKGYTPQAIENRLARDGGYTAGSIKSMMLDGRKSYYNTAETVVPFGNSAFIIPPRGSKAYIDYSKKMGLELGGVMPTFAAKGASPARPKGTSPDTKRPAVKYGEEEGYRHHEASRELRAGWKLHLAVDPKKLSKVDEWLDKNYSGYYKFGKGGEAGDSDFTLYIGDKTTANRIAKSIEKEISDLLLPASPDRLAIDAPFSKHVYGRFDPRGTPEFSVPTGLEYDSKLRRDVPSEIGQWGIAGVPRDIRALREQQELIRSIRFGDTKRISEAKGEVKAEYLRIHKTLVDFYGEFYTGSKGKSNARTAELIDQVLSRKGQPKAPQESSPSLSETQIKAIREGSIPENLQPVIDKHKAKAAEDAIRAARVKAYFETLNNPGAKPNQPNQPKLKARIVSPPPTEKGNLKYPSGIPKHSVVPSSTVATTTPTSVTTPPGGATPPKNRKFSFGNLSPKGAGAGAAGFLAALGLDYIIPESQEKNMKGRVLNAGRDFAITYGAAVAQNLVGGKGRSAFGKAALMPAARSAAIGWAFDKAESMIPDEYKENLKTGVVWDKEKGSDGKMVPKMHNEQWQKDWGNEWNVTGSLLKYSKAGAQGYAYSKSGYGAAAATALQGVSDIATLGKETFSMLNDWGTADKPMTDKEREGHLASSSEERKEQVRNYWQDKKFANLSKRGQGGTDVLTRAEIMANQEVVRLRKNRTLKAQYDKAVEEAKRNETPLPQKPVDFERRERGEDGKYISSNNRPTLSPIIFPSKENRNSVKSTPPSDESQQAYLNWEKSQQNFINNSYEAPAPLYVEPPKPSSKATPILWNTDGTPYKAANEESVSSTDTQSEREKRLKTYESLETRYKLKVFWQDVDLNLSHDTNSPYERSKRALSYDSKTKKRVEEFHKEQDKKIISPMIPSAPPRVVAPKMNRKGEDFVIAKDREEGGDFVIAKDREKDGSFGSPTFDEVWQGRLARQRLEEKSVKDSAKREVPLGLDTPEAREKRLKAYSPEMADKVRKFHTQQDLGIVNPTIPSAPPRVVIPSINDEAFVIGKDREGGGSFAWGHTPQSIERKLAKESGYNAGSLRSMTLDGRKSYYNSAETVVPSGNSVSIIPPRESRDYSNYKAGGYSPPNAQTKMGDSNDLNDFLQKLMSFFNKDFISALEAAIKSSLGGDGKTAGNLAVQWPKLDVTVDGNVTLDNKPVSQDNNLVNMIVNRVIEAIKGNALNPLPISQSAGAGAGQVQGEGAE